MRDSRSVEAIGMVFGMAKLPAIDERKWSHASLFIRSFLGGDKISRVYKDLGADETEENLGGSIIFAADKVKILGFFDEGF